MIKHEISLCVCDNDDDKKEEGEKYIEDSDNDNDDNDVIWCYTRLKKTSNLSRICKFLNR